MWFEFYTREQELLVILGHQFILRFYVSSFHANIELNLQSETQSAIAGHDAVQVWSAVVHVPRSKPISNVTCAILNIGKPTNPSIMCRLSLIGIPDYVEVDPTLVPRTLR